LLLSHKEKIVGSEGKEDGLLQADAAAKTEVLTAEKDVGHCSKPIRKGLKSILAKEWNVERPSWHGRDILGDEGQKSMAWTRLICNQMKEFLLEKLVEDGASERAKREVTKRCDIAAKCLLLFDSFLAILHADHEDLAPELMAKATDHTTEKHWQCGGC
jgi:hypothetical protein